ncbi:hypothetical protein GYA49_03495 [Candidatus Beckwithbacteria bacterium]|nr:hypothetical protein [Candidatus Beckwithbacteria bacterium]
MNFFQTNSAKQRAILILSFIVLFLIACLFVLSLFRYFNHDGFEHIHTTWYLTQGKVPYKDFYQHHNPLFWYLLYPIVFLLQNNSFILISARVLMWLLAVGIGITTYFLCFKVSRQKILSLFSVLLLLACPFFLGSAIEIRPDVPQVLFGLTSIYFLLDFFDKNSKKSLTISSFFVSFSFLFLQKTIFLLTAYAFLFMYEFLRKKIAIKQIVFFVLVFLIPQFIFILWLYINNALPDYILTSWQMNVARKDSVSPFWIVKSIYGLAFFGSCIISSLGILSIKIFTQTQKKLAFLSLTLLASVFIVPYAYLQYFLFSIPLLIINLALFSAYFLKKIQNIFNIHIVFILILGSIVLFFIHPYLQETKLFALVFFIFACIAMYLIKPKAMYTYAALSICLTLYFCPTYLHYSHLWKQNKTNIKQRKIIDLVVKNTKPEDMVYDGNINYNLFRPDLHYFWYSIKENRGLGTYNRLTNNKYGNFNLCSLIENQKPAVISGFGYNIDQCGLKKYYQKIITKKDYVVAIYVRKDLNISPTEL